MDALLPMLVRKQSFTFNQFWIELVFLPAQCLYHFQQSWAFGVMYQQVQ